MAKLRHRKKGIPEMELVDTVKTITATTTATKENIAWHKEKN